MEKEASKFSAVVSFLIPTTKKMSDHLNWRQALLCNLGFACYCAGFVALVWLALDPVMEKEDLAVAHAATPAGAVLGDWVDGQSLRGAGVGSHFA